MIRTLLKAIGSLINLAGEPIERPRWMRSELSGPEQDAEAFKQDAETLHSDFENVFVCHPGEWTPLTRQRAEDRIHRRRREEI